MVSLKMSSRFKTPFKPFKNAIAMSRTRSTVRRQFKHVTCTDEELSQYFKDATAARAAMMELSERSWEYQFEFAVEISKQCHFVMDDDPNMNEAYNFFENWIEKHPHSPCQRFPLLTDTLLLTNLYPRAQRLVISEEALQFGLSYCLATSHKKPLHRIAVDKSNQLGLDLLSQRQRALERLVPNAIRKRDLWDWEYDTDGKMVKVPSRVHLEWLCWGFTPDEQGIWECGNREFGDRLSAVL